MESTAAVELKVRLCTGDTGVYRILRPSGKLWELFSQIEARLAPAHGHSLVYYFGGVRLDGEQRLSEAGLISGSVIDCQQVADTIVELEVRVYTGQSLAFEVAPSSKLFTVLGQIEAKFAPAPGHSLVYCFGDVRLDGEQRVGEAGLISGSVIDCQQVADRIGPAKPSLMALTRPAETQQEAVIQGVAAASAEAGDAGGRTVLHHAAWEGQEGLVGLLLASGVESDIQDEDGMTALTLASSRGHVGVAWLLVLAKQGREGAEEQLASALQHAAYIGHEKVLALLLDMEVKGAIPRISDEAKKAALICAGVGGRVGIVPMLQKSLRDEGAMGRPKGTALAFEWAALAGHSQAKVVLMQRGVSPRKWRHQTPLMKACQEGLMGVVQVLTWGLDREELSAGDVKGATPLHFATARGHENVMVLLIKRGADPWSKDEKGRTPLIVAILEGHMGVARKLLEHMGGQGLEEGGQKGRTALHLAVSHGEEELAALLVSKGAPLASRDREGLTPLMLAARHGHLIMVQLFVESDGEGLEVMDDKGWTALHWAASTGREDVVAFLKSKQALCDTMCYNGITAIMSAAAGGHLRVVQMLLQDLGQGAVHQGDVYGHTAIHWAAQGGNGEIMTFLMGKGAHANTRATDGLTPFMIAAMRGHLGVMQMLFERVNRLQLEEAAGEGSTALHLAAHNGHEAVVDFLLSKEAEPALRDFRNKTPLVLAAQWGHTGVVRMLAQHVGRARLSEATNAGGTALHYAAKRGHEQTVDVVLNSGADPHIRDLNGEIPLMQACYKSRVAVVRRFLQHMGGRGLGEREEHGATALHLACCKYHSGRSEELVRVLLLAGADHTLRDNMGRTPRMFAGAWKDGKGTALFEWWEGELERAYLLFKARSISEDLRQQQQQQQQQQQAPSAPAPTYLQARVAAGRALPAVQVVAIAEHEREEEKEEERSAVLAFVVTGLGSDLFTELMHGFHVQSSEYEDQREGEGEGGH